MSRRMRRCLGAAALLCAALSGAAAPAGAREGDARAGLFIGTTTYALDSYTTYGTTFGGSYGYEFQNDLMWTLGGAFSSTNGEATVQDAMGNPQVVDLKANSAAFQTGLVAFFNRSRGSLVVPYVGAGLSFLNYDISFPGTTIGTTSGTGPGAYAQAGIELRLTRAITLIPQLGLQVHTIKTESGDSKGLLSGGLVFTIRIST
jgi:hypothetical protein